MRAVPMKRIRLPFAFNHCPMLARTLGHGLRHVGRVNITIRVVIKRAFQIVGAD